MSAELQIHLFGSPKLFVNGNSLPPFLTHKSGELFGYLAANPNRAHPRILLAGLLWPETTDEKARASLSTELWRLRRVLGDAQDCLTLTRDEVSLSIDPLHVDVHLFNEQAQRADYSSFLQAVDLYTGDFLEGCYSDWCVLEREKLKDVFLKTLEKLLQYHEARGEWKESVAFAKRLIVYDPLREELHRSLMSLYVNMGNRPSALAQYRLCSEYLRRELGVEPMPETQRLFEKINSASKPEALWQVRVEAAAERTQRKLSELERSRRYLPEVFVNRTVLDDLMEQFVVSPSVGFVLTAPSGYGKTTWLTNFAGQRLAQGDLVLFYEAGALTLSFERELARDVWGSDVITISEALIAVGREARQHDKQAWIIVDDLNSFRDLGATPADLMRRLNLVISHPELQSAVQAGNCSLEIIITCRDYTWKQMTESSAITLNWDSFFLYKPFQLQVFDPAEAGEALRRYSSHYKLGHENTPQQNQVFYKHPLLLRLLSEIGQGKQVSAVGSENLLFREYFLKMTPQSSVRGLAVAMATWMAEHKQTSASLMELRSLAQTYGANLDAEDSPLKHLLDTGILSQTDRGLEQVFRFTHDRLFEYLLAEHIQREMENRKDDADILVGYIRQTASFPPAYGAALMVLSSRRNTGLYLSFAVSEFSEVRELCVDGLIALYLEEPKLALSVSKQILALDSLDAKRVALRAVPAMGEEGFEIFYSAIGSFNETVRRVALISFDQLWRQDFQRAVRMMRRLMKDINPQVLLLAPRRVQTLFKIIGWFSTYEIPRPVFDEINNAAYELAVEKLRMPTSESQTRFWSLIKNILARNTVSWPANEDAIHEILRPNSLSEKEKAAFRRVVSGLQQGTDGLNDISIEDIKTLLMCQVDPACYPAHHLFAVWLHHRPAEACAAMRQIFDDLNGHARLWLLMAFVPTTLSSPMPFPHDALHLLEEFTARFAEENETEFLHGTTRGTLQPLNAVSFFPLGVRYLRSGKTDFPLISSLLTLSKDQLEKFALTVRLLAPLGWFYPRETLNFLEPFLDFTQPLHAHVLETFANLHVFHSNIVDTWLQEHGAGQHIRTSADLEQVTYRAHLITTQDVRITSILLNSPYGQWLTRCVLPGYLEVKTPKEAAQRFGDGLFESLRQCDWHLKRLFGMPD
ncbi:MAG: hypothetical protein FJZ86_08410 [Chloroflexi bacterium]|nr:hypothetical protein [Chloroflexota bacterium]